MNESNLAIVFGPNLLRPKQVTQIVYITSPTFLQIITRQTFDRVHKITQSCCAQITQSRCAQITQSRCTNYSILLCQITRSCCAQITQSSCARLLNPAVHKSLNLVASILLYPVYLFTYLSFIHSTQDSSLIGGLADTPAILLFTRSLIQNSEFYFKDI